ncbi:MAG: exodeoxyribonuclease VII small subunit, partial [Eubacteriales bacterium]
MERLETIVKRLESGDETLDAALTDFETATALIQYCNEQLTQAE